MPKGKKEEQSQTIEIPKEFIEVPDKERKPVETTTQTQTFETKFLERMTEVINQKTNINLEQPTKKAKGTKKVLFKYITLFALQGLGIKDNEAIKKVLELGKYV